MAVIFFGNLFANENCTDYRLRKIFVADVSGGDPRITYYVATNGNDGNPGMINQPFASLEHARDAIRAAKNSPNFNGAAVYIRGGIYTLNQGFRLSQADSGTGTAAIVYQAYQNEKVVLSGGKAVNNFIPVPDDNPVADRLDPCAKPHILQADLRQAGITDFGVLAHANYLIPSVPAALGVFFNHQPMTLAHWPNTGWNKIAAGGTNSFQDASGRPRRWKELSDIWMHGYFKADYADDHEKIAGLELASGTITSDMASFGYAAWQQGNQGGRFYYENVLEELDSPGEWYLDRTTGILYFWPPGTIAGNAVVASTLNSPMISLSNTSYVTFSGLDLDVGA